MQYEGSLDLSFLNAFQNKSQVVLLFFAETVRSFFVETFWSLKHFGHLSHSCIKTHYHSVF